MTVLRVDASIQGARSASSALADLVLEPFASRLPDEAVLRPQHVKAWIDLAIVGGPSAPRLLEGKPVVLIVTRGGAYGPGTPKEGWEHASQYLVRVLVDVWRAELTVVERELTLVGVNPALDAFTDLAAVMKTAAEDAATTAGHALAERLASNTTAAA
jgi:FMN-dependent NADH-azoreductase